MSSAVKDAVTPYGSQLNTQVNSSDSFENETELNPLWARSDEEKAIVLAEHVSGVFTHLNDETTREIEVQLPNLPSNITKIHN